MIVITGRAASPGIAWGSIYIYDPMDTAMDPLINRTIPLKNIPGEIKQLEKSFAQASKNLDKMISAYKNSPDKNATDVLNFHRQVINDPKIFEDSLHRIKHQKLRAHHAVSEAFNEYINIYKQKGVYFKHLISDFIDIRNRLLYSVNKISDGLQMSAIENQPMIIATRMLTPSMVLEIPREKTLGFITKEGGLTTHATILARAYGIPIIFGVNIDDTLKNGEEAIVDAYREKIYLNPGSSTKRYYASKIGSIAKRKYYSDDSKALPAATACGTRVTVRLNINSPDELDTVSSLPHDGIGLLRSEFMFLERNTPPTEDEQYSMYSRILVNSGDRPVTIRLLDFDVDKLPSYFELPGNTEIKLKFRGSRLVDLLHDAYMTQVRAILRAGVHGNVRILYPMVSDLSDLAVFRKLVSEARKSLRRDRIKYRTKIPDGIMIETPSAVAMCRELLENADFANIGTNDLLQYVLAVSRDMAVIEERYHILHPSLAKFIEMIMQASKETGREVCICGVVASYESFYPLFLAMGLKCFSVPVFCFDEIRLALGRIKEERNGSLLKKFYSLKNKKQMDSFFRKYR